MTDPGFAWMNGRIIPWGDAKVHVRTDGFMRGASVFEGIRAYASVNGDQLYAFRNGDHLDRMFNTSMKILRMRMAWSPDDITAAILELLRVNGFHQDVHIRPQVYFGVGQPHGYLPGEIEVGCVITAIERRQDGEALRRGLHVCTSTWRRLDDQVMPPRVKAGGNYVNSRYATVEARVNGYDSSILLDARGKVTEAPGACVMIVRKGRVSCPPDTNGVLESVTVDTLVRLFAEELHMDVVRREIDRSELYVADEVFLCGTGEEIQPIVSVDRYEVGNGERGPVVTAIQDAYFRTVRGDIERYRAWLLPVYERVPAATLGSPHRG